jgi:hypothetical protein
MAKTKKSDGDGQLSEQEEEWGACDVQNPFVTEKIRVRKSNVNEVA